MDEMNMTGINYEIHSKLKQECKIIIEDCFKQPEDTKTKFNITIRRQSIRLQAKGIPCMKEATYIKSKNKTKKVDLNAKSLALLKNETKSPDTTNNSQAIPLQSNDESLKIEIESPGPTNNSQVIPLHSNVGTLALLKNETESPDTRNNSQAIPLQTNDESLKNETESPGTTNNSAIPSQIDLTDNDIMELLNDMTSFIEDGVWSDSTSDSADLNLLCPSHNLLIYPLSTASDNSVPVDVLKSHGEISYSDKITRTEDFKSDSDKLIRTSSPYDSQCSVSTETDFHVQCSSSRRTDFDNQRSALTQTHFENQSSISTQTSFKEWRKDQTVTSSNCSTQTDSRSATYVQPFTKSSGHSRRSSLKRKRSFNTDHPQGRMVSPKLLTSKCTQTNPRSSTYVQPFTKSSGDSRRSSLKQKMSFKTDQPQGQMVSPKLLTSKSNFDLMKKEAVILLQDPCIKFLQQENCGLHCQRNHSLPPLATITGTVKNWSSLMIHFFYVTYIQRYMMCHLMYFEVVCNAFVERRLPENILATVKDCERLSLEGNFKIIFLCLKKCGYSGDDALFEICTHAYRSKNTVNEILKIITTFNVVNFKRAIAFLATNIETFDFDPWYGDEILKQACEMETLDETLLEFCYVIIKKFYNILNEHYMRMLLIKCKTL